MQRTTFLQYLKFEKRFSTHTLTAYNSDLEQFYAYIKVQYDLSNSNKVKHIHIRSWIVKLIQDKISTRTINRKLSSLKCYFKFLNKRGYLEFNPTLKIIAPKTIKNIPSFIRSANMSNIFESKNFEDNYAGIRDRTILETFYSTGIRRAELIGLKIEDIDFEKQFLKVLGKGKKVRLIPFSLTYKKVLRNYLVLRKEIFPIEHGYLFLTDKGCKLYPKLVYNIVKKYLAGFTDVKQKSPHILRHSFATHISDNGADLSSVKELLGHSSLAATQIYTHNSIDKMKNVYYQAHPKAKINR